ncbi:hypothetical protein J2S28_005659 [Rhizobium sp. SLBN-94]|nr:hypothetical protein [Rhizobium sp. SLBN-94]
MKKKILGLSAASVAGALALVGGYLTMPDGTGPAPALAQVGTVTFPELKELVHYTTVRRGVTREHMLTDQSALEAIQAGEPVPTGTHFVLVDYQSNVLTRYLIAEKTGDGPDDWTYQPFNADRTIRTVDESPARCYSCHQSRQDRQYLFTYNDARSFKP